MRKKFLVIFQILLVVLLCSACNNSPLVGEWHTDYVVYNEQTYNIGDGIDVGGSTKVITEDLITFKLNADMTGTYIGSEIIWSIDEETLTIKSKNDTFSFDAIYKDNLIKINMSMSEQNQLFVYLVK